MKMSWYSKLIAASFAVILTVAGCKKEDKVVIPPSQATFTGQTGGTYFITGPNVTYKIPVGVTTVSDKDRTVNISVTSPTGAKQGTQFTLSSNTITIPAGKAIDSLEIKGIYDQYTAGRKDTLVFTISGEGVTPSTYNNTYKLLMRGPCFEGDVNLDELVGTYVNCYDDASYGPYQMKIVSATSVSPTTANIVIHNLYDAGFNDLTFTIDWTNPNNRTLTFIAQNTGQDAGIMSNTYKGMPLWIYPIPTKPGTFSACKGTFTINYQMGIPNVGKFPAEFSTLAR